MAGVRAWGVAMFGNGAPVGCTKPKPTQGLFTSSDITPYLHTFFNHVPQLLLMHGHLANFSCTAVEKKNHVLQTCFFSCTFLNGGVASYKVNQSAVQQTLRRELRMLHYAHSELYPAITDIEPV